MKSGGQTGAGAVPASASGSPLPRGPHRLPREYVVENQRSRLLAGVAMAMAERGYAKLTVENVITAAGVSRTTFYQNFESKHDCVRAAHDEAFDRLAGAIFRACAVESEWAAKLMAAVSAAIRFAIDNPDEARLLVFDAVGSDPELAARVLASNDHLVGLLRAGRDQCPQAASLPELTERAMIGAATSIVGSRIMSGQADRLPELESQLIQLVLIPYVGIEEAERMAAP